jgi:hypothetical protein
MGCDGSHSYSAEAAPCYLPRLNKLTPSIREPID